MPETDHSHLHKHIAVIVAGGKGLRMQSGTKKQFMDLEGIPVLVRTLMAFDTCCQVNEMILVLPEQDLDFCRNTLIRTDTFTTPLHFIKGGATRQESVANGLVLAQKLSAHPEKTLVLVHDGVRPFVTRALVTRCVEGALKKGACIPGIQITDTVKKADHNAMIRCTLDRQSLYRAQTPQVFRLDLILKAFSHARKTRFLGTDEASLFEHAKIPVLLVEGERFNIKLTTPGDLVFARLILGAENTPDIL